MIDKYCVIVNASVQWHSWQRVMSRQHNYQDAMKSKQKKKWIDAMNDEFDSLIKNDTWKPVDLRSFVRLPLQP